MRVTGVERIGERIQVKTRESDKEEGYDLLVVAAGVNTPVLKLFEESGMQYHPPKTTRTAIREYYLGREAIDKHFGASLHVFLLNIPRLDFAMVVPKGDYASVCMLGKDVDEDLIQAFLTAPEVKSCFPEGWRWDQPGCQCLPRINVQAAVRPYADRLVFIGDSGVSRLKKDGIGAAYRAAKAAAACAILEGISAEDFERYYGPFCRTMELENDYGRFIFFVTRIIQRVRFSRKAMLQMAAADQRKQGVHQRMSSVLWDTFTGSAPYSDVLLRTLHPVFLSRFILNLFSSAVGG
jgi:flavin-dependent dehydrogenase